MSVQTAESSNQAECIISKWQPHICILDLGLNDVEYDEFFLLKKYARDFPFIIVSAATDIERAFTATNCGAAGMFAKPLDFYSMEVWESFRDVFLERCILPVLENSTNPVFRECCNVLKNDLPRNVVDWANKVGITDTYLRKMWADFCCTSPKHLLFIYKLYKDVFDLCNRQVLSYLNENNLENTNFDETEWRQRISYYLIHRNTLNKIRENRGVKRLATPIKV